MFFGDESQRYDRLTFWDKAERLMISRSPFCFEMRLLWSGLLSGAAGGA